MNPSGADRSALGRWMRLEPTFRRIVPNLVVHRSTAPGDLTRIARAVARSHAAKLIVAAGGDGTSHEVINGLIEQGRPIDPELRMAWLPLGSGNDLAHALGYRNAARDAPGSFGALQPGQIDLGQVEFGGADGGRRTVVFGNSLTFGITSDVLRLTSRSRKRLGGRMAYALAALRVLIRYQPAELTLATSGGRARGPTWLVSITNGPSFGAGMRITPDARLDDGLLDLVRVAGGSRLELVSLFPRVYWGGHAGHRLVEHSRATSLEVDSPTPLDFEVDGELHHGIPPFAISILPLALPIVRPRGPRHRSGDPFATLDSTA